jgi:hypothetical protein
MVILGPVVGAAWQAHQWAMSHTAVVVVQRDKAVLLVAVVAGPPALAALAIPLPLRVEQLQ